MISEFTLSNLKVRKGGLPPLLLVSSVFRKEEGGKQPFLTFEVGRVEWSPATALVGE